MKIFQVHAGGFYTSGMALVLAVTFEHAITLANEASDPEWKLTYYGMRGEIVVGEMTEDKPNPRVLAIHEYGMPHLPSKGSGIRVTF